MIERKRRRQIADLPRKECSNQKVEEIKPSSKFNSVPMQCVALTNFITDSWSIEASSRQKGIWCKNNESGFWAFSVRTILLFIDKAEMDIHTKIMKMDYDEAKTRILENELIPKEKCPV